MNQMENVFLFQYDITNGMATKIAKFMTGRDIEAIWHTSIVVFGNEYFFSSGINKGMPRKTMYGTPKKESLFGTTNKNKEEFEKYLISLDDKFNTETYHIIKNNCNHFTDAALKYLCNKGLPDEILNQQKLMDDTAFGKFIIKRMEIMSEQQNQKLNNIIEGKK